MMSRLAFLLQLFSVLAFGTGARAEEKEIVTPLMKVESARMVILREGGRDMLMLRAVLKNISDKPVVVELGQEPMPGDGKPVYDLHYVAFTYYDKFLGAGLKNDEWMSQKKAGSFLSGPKLKIGPGESISIEQSMIPAGPRDFTKEMKSSYETQGIRFHVWGNAVDEKPRKIIAEGFCKFGE